MENKKDIGKLIEDRLKNTTEAPSGLTWEQVSHSLDERERKKRVLLFVWSGIAFSGLIILALLFFNPNKQLDKNTVVEAEQNSPSIQKEATNSNTSINEPTLEKQNDVSEAPNVQNKNMEPNSDPVVEKESETKPLQKKENLLTSQKSENVSNPKEHWTIHTAQDDMTKTFTVDSVTTYRYYNHDTQDELITTNKKTIDSLVQLSEKVVDSIR